MLLKRLTTAVSTLVVVGSVLAVDGAAAATYAVHGCKTPAGAPAPLDGWVSTKQGARVEVQNRCAAGGPLAGGLARGFAHEGTAGFEAQFTAPADTSIATYFIWRSTQLGQSADYSYSYVLFAGARNDAHVAERCDGAAGCAGFGNPNTPVTLGNRVAANPAGDAKRLWIGTYCRPKKVASCAASTPSAALQIHRTELRLNDMRPPVLSAPPAGALATQGAILSGVAGASVTASDLGSGVATAAIEVDGKLMDRQTLDANQGRCVEPYRYVVPCRLAASGNVALDTTALPDGDHIVRIFVFDATGQNFAVSDGVAVRTANGPCVASAANPAYRVTAGLRGRRTRTVAFGRSGRLSGRLLTQAGQPVPGAQVCVLLRREADPLASPLERLLTTDAEGRYRMTIPSGPSREATVIYNVAGQGAATAAARLVVRAKPTLRASQRRLSNGDRLVLSGRLLGGNVPRGGVLVTLQARRGAGWQPFGTTRASRSGRFRLKYRFTRTTGVQRYVMRAVVARQSGYPFTTGSSRPVVVRVGQ